MFKVTEKLAIDGGKPIREKPFPNYTIILDEKEIKAVENVLRSGRLRRGPVVEEYEKRLAEYLGVSDVLVVANGTVALHLAVAALDLSPGDEVICTPYTFVASASVALYQGAIPIFADIDPDYYTLDPQKIEEKISDKTKGIIVVHLAGHPADMDPIKELADHYNLWVIEDTAQALGAKYKQKLAGGIGEVGTFSTVEGKIMATGEGGFCATNDSILAEKMGSLHNFYRKHATSNIHQFYGIGYNYRATEIQAAIGQVQLDRLEAMLHIRRKNAQYLTNNLRNIEGVTPPKEASWAEHAYYYYPLRIDPSKITTTITRFKEALNAEGIPISDDKSTPLLHLTDMFTQKKGFGVTQYPYDAPYYSKSIEYKVGQLPIAEKIYKETFWLTDALPILEISDLDEIIEAVAKVTSNYLQ